MAKVKIKFGFPCSSLLGSMPQLDETLTVRSIFRFLLTICGLLLPGILQITRELCKRTMLHAMLPSRLLHGKPNFIFTLAISKPRSKDDLSPVVFNGPVYFRPTKSKSSFPIEWTYRNFFLTHAGV
jgi:hypothetical protein